MGYNTESTEWPSSEVQPRVKVLIDRFFNLLDTTTDGVGDALADEIFAPDAKVQFGLQTFEGQERRPTSLDLHKQYPEVLNVVQRSAEVVTVLGSRSLPENIEY
jgi:hypothetical protein